MHIPDAVISIFAAIFPRLVNIVHFEDVRQQIGMMDLPSLCTLTAQPVLDRYFISGTSTDLLHFLLKSTDVLFLKTDHVSHFWR